MGAKERLDEKNLVEALLLLERKFNFTNPSYYQNTFLYLERLMERYGISYRDIEEMCVDVDTSDIENRKSWVPVNSFEPSLTIYYFMKKYLENRGII